MIVTVLGAFKYWVICCVKQFFYSRCWFSQVTVSGDERFNFNALSTFNLLFYLNHCISCVLTTHWINKRIWWWWFKATKFCNRTVTTQTILGSSKVTWIGLLRCRHGGEIEVLEERTSCRHMSLECSVALFGEGSSVVNNASQRCQHGDAAYRFASVRSLWTWQGLVVHCGKHAVNGTWNSLDM